MKKYKVTLTEEQLEAMKKAGIEPLKIKESDTKDDFWDFYMWVVIPTAVAIYLLFFMS